MLTNAPSTVGGLIHMTTILILLRTVVNTFRRPADESRGIAAAVATATPPDPCGLRRARRWLARWRRRRVDRWRGPGSAARSGPGWARPMRPASRGTVRESPDRERRSPAAPSAQPA